MHTPTTPASPRSRGRRAALAAASVVLVACGALALVPPTSAGYTDATYAQADLTTELTLLPVPYDQSAGTGLFLTPDGALYTSGQRASGNGAGGTSTAADAPTRVAFPAGTVVVEAIGSSNDFTDSAATSWAALDADGHVWTWGRPVGLPGLLGRGPLSLAASYTPGQVVPAPGAGSLPRFIDLERIENQFLALDESGRMWAWGYGGENLPLSSLNPTGNSYPTVVDAVAVTPGAGACTGANNGGAVTWHSIWGGNNAAAAVSTSGLVYTWGYDHGALDGTWTIQRCPILNDQANRALFRAHPDLYTTADGRTYDESVLTTEAERLARYTEIVQHSRTRTLEACAAPVAKTVTTVDDSGCPVRQFGYSARAPRMLLAGGDLYTWQVATEVVSGAPMLGRASTSNTWSVEGSRYRATVALRGVEETSAGIGHVRALLADGRVLGWGRNSHCQAIGARASGAGSCDSPVAAEIVTLPREVVGQPAGITRLATTACLSWMASADGALWASGAGSDAGYAFVQCAAGVPAAPAYDQTPPHRDGTPYGTRVTQNLSVRQLR